MPPLRSRFAKCLPKRAPTSSRSICWATNSALLTVYLDDAGEKPPHALLWDIATVKSATLNSDAPLTCGAVVGGKLWVCSADGKTLTMSQYD